MGKSFKLQEILPEEVCENPFGVGDTGIPLFECVRILCGSVDLQSKTSTSYVKLRRCHVSQKTRRPRKSAIDNIVDIIFDGDLSKDDARIFLEKSTWENRKFWEELRSELSFCLYWRGKNRSVESFLHLYRIYELISVALPLVHASRISDFREAVSFIKSLSRNERDKDLAVLRYFSEELSKSPSLNVVDIDFPFLSIDTRIRQELSDQIEKWVLKEKNVVGELLDAPDFGVKIKFASVPSFIVSCRNRLFHNALSNDNFKLDALHGPEGICKVLIDPALYWFSFVFVEILKSQAGRYV